MPRDHIRYPIWTKIILEIKVWLLEACKVKRTAEQAHGHLGQHSENAGHLIANEHTYY